MGTSHQINPKRFLSKLETYLFLLPHFTLFVAFVLIPLGYGFFISLHRWSLLATPRPVGWDNYVRIWSDTRFWEAASNTALFALISVPLSIALGLTLALLLNQNLYGRLWLLIAFVSPAFFGSIGILLSWNWILASSPSGLANYYLNQLGILGGTISWFSTARAAWFWIVVITVWWIVGFGALLFLGALQRIPPEQYESAMIDGASVFDKFWYITLPWTRNVIVFEAVRQTILAFGLFDQIFILTEGGPAGATRTLVFYLYQMGFERQQFGFAAAISWYIFISIILFGMVQLFLISRSIQAAEVE